MQTKFFNFGNEETFHFFKWISESGRADQFIEGAFTNAQADEWLKLGAGVAEALRDALAGELQEVIADELSGVDEANPQNLSELLLVVAAERIDCGRVAEALLIRAGKWPRRDISSG